MFDFLDFAVFEILLPERGVLGVALHYMRFGPKDDGRKREDKAE